MSLLKEYTAPILFNDEKHYKVSGIFLNALFDAIKIPRENTEAELCYKLGYFTSVIEKEDFNEIPT